MTAETELLPLPGLPNIGSGGQWSGWSDDDMRTYARACVIHATAAKDAEPVETVFCLRGDLWDRALIAEARVAELQARVAELERFHDVVQTAMQIHVIGEAALALWKAVNGYDPSSAPAAHAA